MLSTRQEPIPPTQTSHLLDSAWRRELMLGGSTSLNEPRQKIRRSSIFQGLMNNWVRRMQKLELEQDTTTYDWGMLGPEKMHALELPQRDRARVGVAQGLERGGGVRAPNPLDAGDERVLAEPVPGLRVDGPERFCQ